LFEVITKASVSILNILAAVEQGSSKLAAMADLLIARLAIVPAWEAFKAVR
jgi:hypothetical protein